MKHPRPRVFAAALAPALFIFACASAPAPLPSLRATQGPVSKPCAPCSPAERCREDGVCAPTRITAVPLPAAAPISQFAAAEDAREQARARTRRRIKASRITALVGTGILVTGTIILAATLAAAAPKGPQDDGNDGFEFLWGAIPTSIGALTTIASIPIWLNSRNRLRELAEPQRPSLRARPSWSVGSYGAQAGLVVDLHF